jgi:hypothetical protein
MIKVSAKLIGARHPNENWSGIGCRAEALLTLAQLVFDVLELSDVYRHTQHSFSIAFA